MVEGESAVEAQIADAIARDGLAVAPDFLTDNQVAALRTECRRRDAEGLFTSAQVGRSPTRAERTEVRGDRTLWLDDVNAAAAEVPLRRAFEALRIELNRALFLGLFDLEAHYAIYPPGAGYQRHSDRFRGEAANARILSCVLYLNESWGEADGGALRIHREQGAIDVQPFGGTLVCFLAERFEHEVLPARRERLSVTGWFRARA
jgi:SM-20-related protein